MRIGRWSLALKQGVVLKLARSVVVPGGLKWVECSPSHTYNSQPLAFTHLPLAPSLSVAGKTFSSRWISHKNHRYLRAVGEHHPQKCLHVSGFHLITLTWVADLLDPLDWVVPAPAVQLLFSQTGLSAEDFCSAGESLTASIWAVSWGSFVSVLLL